MNAEIVAIELAKTKAGSNAVKIVIKTADGQWLRYFIGGGAPQRVHDMVWGLIDETNQGFHDYASPGAYSLIGVNCQIETSQGDYGTQVDEIRKPVQAIEVEPETDEIPF